jgi:hypothetical protein
VVRLPGGSSTRQRPGDEPRRQLVLSTMPPGAVAVGIAVDAAVDAPIAHNLVRVRSRGGDDPTLAPRSASRRHEDDDVGDPRRALLREVGSLARRWQMARKHWFHCVLYTPPAVVGARLCGATPGSGAGIIQRIAPRERAAGPPEGNTTHAPMLAVGAPTPGRIDTRG